MPPRLTTDRLILRPFYEQDIPVAYTLFEGHPDVFRYDPGYRRTYEQRAARILAYAAENDKNGCGTLAIVLKETNALIGYAGLQFYVLPRQPYATAEVELFYKLGRDFWQQGYAAEAGRETLRFAFEKMNLDHIASVVNAANVRSIRVLERLGARIDPAPPQWKDEVIGVVNNPAKGKEEEN